MQSDRIIAVIIVAFSLWLYGVADEFPKGTDTFPKLLLVTLIFLATLLFAQSLRRQRESVHAGEKSEKVSARNFVPPAITFLGCVAFVALVPVLGYFTSGVLFSAAMMFYLGARRMRTFLISIAGVMLFIYILFIMQLRVPVPHGLLF
ncbi:MAG: putative tricarboxylic transport rane protein [Bacillota bacterium]|jgi:cell division protein FtsW (lipid II flippase)|nr:putative tricarboxylic transport rane protein [Bacillota bacterium]MDK2855250.1 putative tricarboxylic transport rane protein [Bacillota bacterium]MDK2924439.1 putative tricarboxylic transport rane protein [Bacillota bacterium]